MNFRDTLREIAKKTDATDLLLMTYEIDEAIKYMETTLEKRVKENDADRFAKNSKAQLNSATYRRYKMMSWIDANAKVTENTEAAYTEEIKAVENSIYALLYDLWMDEHPQKKDDSE